MTLSKFSSTQAPPPQRALILRASGLTTLFYFGILIVPFIIAYFYKPEAFILSNFMKFPFPSIGTGVLVGILVIWLVFPRPYLPKESHEFSPKALWVYGWIFVIFPLLYLVMAGISPFELISIPTIQDIRDPQTLTNSPILRAVGIANIFFFLTYYIFFSTLKFCFKKQNSKPSTASSLS